MYLQGASNPSDDKPACCLDLEQIKKMVCAYKECKPYLISVGIGKTARKAVE